MLVHVLDRFALKDVEAKKVMYEKVSDKLIDNKLYLDKLEAASRSDHIILHGHAEPAQNYNINGYETQEQFEKYIIEAAGKVGVEIKSEHISFAHRIGQRPRNATGGPRLRENGENFCCPILFKFIKRAKKEALMRQKKTLKDSHSIKISEDQTLLRKALCNFVNELESVKVAYPQNGKVLVRLQNNPDKVIRIESFRDLHRVGYSGRPDFTKLKLDGVILTM